MGKIFQANGSKNLAVDILITNKIDCKPKLIKIDKNEHLIFTKGKI